MSIRLKKPIVKLGQKNPGAFAPGQSGNRRGRPKGCKSKIGKTVKENILWVFEQLGGKKEFLLWAKKNPDVYYEKILMKVVPIENLVQGALSVEHAHAVTVMNIDGRIQDLLMSVRVNQEVLPAPEGEVIDVEAQEVAVASEP